MLVMCCSQVQNTRVVGSPELKIMCSSWVRQLLVRLASWLHENMKLNDVVRRARWHDSAEVVDDSIGVHLEAVQCSSDCFHKNSKKTTSVFIAESSFRGLSLAPDGTLLLGSARRGAPLKGLYRCRSCRESLSSETMHGRRAPPVPTTHPCYNDENGAA